MNSKLLKEAIADAKAVRETALANAKIALEEAFTPKLQSMLSRKLQEELEGEEVKEEDEVEMTQENDVSSEIGKGDGTKMPAAAAFDSAAKSDELAAADVDQISAEVGSEDENAEKVADITEGEEEEDITGATPDSAMNEEEGDEDDLDIEEIIKELEAEADAEEAPVAEEDEVPAAEEPVAAEGEEPAVEAPVEEEEEIDLDEILREMGYGDEAEEEAPVTEEEDGEDHSAELAAKDAELEEAYKVIGSLRKTINEVNLLNAKLLYVNKLFRNYNLTNEQKTKVVETLDRTKNVREVKLVFTTIAESFKIGSTATKKTATKLTESYASKPVKSTAPAKQIIAEDNSAAERFKKLAGIIK